MYIEPKTNIKLLKNVPLDNTYEHTVYFSDATVQSTAFASYVKYNLTGYSYQRINRGYARVGICADNVYDCNYMMFQNSAYGNKWFYAFITSVEYVNDVTSEIRFEIDVMQTWLFDYKLGATFVERQHTLSDELFEHYEPEPVDFGDLKTYSVATGTIDWSEWVLVICTTPLDETLALKNDNQISYAEYYVCNNNSVSIKDFINNVLPTGAQESIISAYLVPKVIVESEDYADTEHLPDSYLSEYFTKDIGGITLPVDIDGYKPKNNKLFCSPYTVYEVTDGCGNSQYYKPELFDSNGGAPYYRVVGKYTGVPSIMVIPKNYRGESLNLNEGFECANFPQVATPVDTYKAWLAQRGYSTFLAGMGSLGQVAVGALSANPVVMASGGFGVAQAVNQYMIASCLPNKLQTTDNSDCVAMMMEKHPWFKSKTITALYAEMVDDYFTKYGYSVGKVTTPIRNARPHYTYLKTRGVIIKGSVPSDDSIKIAQIYDRGCTWWKNLTEVGVYSLDNAPS